MRRLPILATLIVAAAIAVMIGLGVWQLQRAGWKERMLAELAAAPSQPPVDLDPLLARGGDVPADLAFRRALVTCTAREIAPVLRAGRTLDGISGFSVFVPCRPGADGWPGRIEVNAGWTRQADYRTPLTLTGITAGSIGTVEPDGLMILTAATPAPGLAASAAPAIADIPNNHLMYAGQWFFFAFTAGLIYLLALRRRRPAVAPPPSEP